MAGPDSGGMARGDGQATGKCVRVWLPDIVLPAGDRLRAALAGVNSINFAHLSKKHAGANFRVFGAANPALPPWKRMQVVAQCQPSCSVEKIEQDMLDLAETACDIVADGLGLSDDQVQQAFEDIRVERSDIKVAPAKASPSRPTGLTFLPRPPSVATIQQQAPLQHLSPMPPTSGQLQPPAPSLVHARPPASMLPPPSSGSALRPPVAAAQRMAGLGTVAASSLGAAAAGAAVVSTAAKSRPSAAKSRPPQAAVSGSGSASMSSLMEPQPKKRPSPSVDMPPPAMLPPKKRKKLSAEAEGTEETTAAPTGGLTTVAAPAAGQATPATAAATVAVATAATTPATASTPPPAREAPATAPGKSAAPAAAPAAAAPEVEAKAIEAARAASQGAEDEEESDSGSSEDSAEEGEEEEEEGEGEESGSSSEEDEEDEDEEDEDATMEGGSEGAVAAAAESREVREAGDSGSADLVPPVRMRLYKLGELCCEVVANFTGGNPDPEPLPETLQIDQRAKLDHCREHLQFAGELVTIWNLSAVVKKQAKAFNALSDYFVVKQRVGLVETPAYSIYVVPPDTGFLETLGLAALGWAKAGCLLALQVPAEVGEEELEGAEAEGGPASTPGAASEIAEGKQA
mmetsp:Transcript_137339/g.342478  ORF Transcript_137339/g.342478 Transcript_137339/m.342478 type:complete len:631 (+) Transcript_137339:86-1978(+)